MILSQFPLTEWSELTKRLEASGGKPLSEIIIEERNNRLCLHAMLALPHRDESHAKGANTETLSDEQWVEIGQQC